MTKTRKVAKTEALVKCTFVSVWDGNIAIKSKALYHPKTGEIDVLETHGVDGIETLEREYIELEDGDELEVCTDCHEYVLRTAMNPGIGHDLNEEKECSDPDCPSRI